MDDRARQPPPAHPELEHEVPEPPWRARPARRPQRPLSREAIVDAALRILDREGADGLTMRRVAEELGTGAASLYWHVGSKDGLIDLVVDRIAGELELPPPDPSQWQAQLMEIGRRMREILHRHRDVARLTLGRIPIGPNLVRIMEWMLALLRGAGLPDRIAAFAGDLFSLYVGAFVYEESLGLGSPSGEDRPPQEVVAMIRDYLASLPPERFPNITAMVDELMGPDPDERFELGLEVLLRGLAAFRNEDHRPPR
ncbi:MAG TPA: TetR/AcrR family transcriptional regulator [Actinomycetota bacterium]|nr:TetR/AcrR family transcriptional regulator [Actinomycetota bacterium]